MANIQKIKIMFSSRSESNAFGGTKLETIRKNLKMRLLSVRWQTFGFSNTSQTELVGGDQELFDVWIHEDTPSEDLDKSTLEVSIQRIKWADLVIVLYNGEAGSAETDEELGICHAELYEALSRRPDIVAMIQLPFDSGTGLDRDQAFRQFVDRQHLFLKNAGNEIELHERAFELLQDRISVLARRGGRGSSRRRDKGRALDWNRLELGQRQAAMREALAEELTAIPKQRILDLLICDLMDGKEVVVRPDAIPASLAVAAARERVGQPFLHDHQHSTILEAKNRSGVIHFIACHRGVTESQALGILGTPDAIAISGDFGVYVADHVQKIQLVFLAECGDDTAIALAVRYFREWLVQSGEGPRVLDRAAARRQILATIAAVRQHGL